MVLTSAIEIQNKESLSNKSASIIPTAALALRWGAPTTLALLLSNGWGAPHNRPPLCCSFAARATKSDLPLQLELTLQWRAFWGRAGMGPPRTAADMVHRGPLVFGLRLI